MFSRKSRRTTAAAALAAAAALVLTGCVNPVEQLMSQGAEQLVEQLIEQGTDGASIDIDSSGGGLSITTEDGQQLNFGASSELPADWPSAVPLPDGEITASVSMPDGIMLTFQTSVADAEALLQKMKNAGFSDPDETILGDIRGYTFRSASHTAQIQWIEEEAGEPIMLSYLLFIE